MIFQYLFEFPIFTIHVITTCLHQPTGLNTTNFLLFDFHTICTIVFFNTFRPLFIGSFFSLPFFDTTLLYFRWFYKLRAFILRFHFDIFPLWFWTLTVFLIRFWLVKQKSRRETWHLFDSFGNNQSIDDSMWNLKSRLRERIHARFFCEKCIFRDFVVF